jgi:hypothetical protein
MDVPNVFPKMFPIPPPFIPLNLIKVEFKDGPKGRHIHDSILEVPTFILGKVSNISYLFTFVAMGQSRWLIAQKKTFGMHPQLIRIHKKTKNPIYI